MLILILLVLILLLKIKMIRKIALKYIRPMVEHTLQVAKSQKLGQHWHMRRIQPARTTQRTKQRSDNTRIIHLTTTINASIYFIELFTSMSSSSSSKLSSLSSSSSSSSWSYFAVPYMYMNMCMSVCVCE